MSTEDTLAAIPSEQLTLRLLQELAARVERLEQANKHANQGGPQERNAESTDTLDKTHGATRVDAISSPEVHATPTASHCMTCNKIIGESCNCVSIPCGYLFHGEVPGTGYDYMPPPSNYPHVEGLTHIEDKVLAIERKDPSLAEQLKYIGFAGIPDDGRLPFENFWGEGKSLQLASAFSAIKDITSVRGHRFWVLDVDLNGNRVLYGRGVSQRYPSSPYPIYGIKLDDEDFSPPKMSYDASLGLIGPWNRLM